MSNKKNYIFNVIEYAKHYLIASFFSIANINTVNAYNN